MESLTLHYNSVFLDLIQVLHSLESETKGTINIDLHVGFVYFIPYFVIIKEP